MLNPNDPELLIEAVHKYDFHKIHQLVRAGANIDAVGRNRNPLHQAIDDEEANVLSYLLLLGADPSFEIDRYRPIHLAIDVEIDSCNNTGRYPEPIAFMTYILLLAGADINAVSRFGDTPLKMARQRGHKQAGSLLEARGALA